MRCLHCGDPNQPRDAEICGACGNPLPAPSLAYGERRQVTIWMADLCGYTGFNEVFDPEEVAAVMDRIERAATRLAHEHGGIVNQFVGDEVVVLYGVPTAHEDDARRAVSSALELHAFVAQLSTELEPKLSQALRLHSGIHSGLILAAMRDARHGLYTLRGDTINVAARLRSIARPNEILLSEPTFQKVAPFYTGEKLQALALKGRAAPITAFRVLGRTSATSTFDVAQQSGLAPLAGRVAELEILTRSFDDAAQGSGRLVTVSGHAGVGKSRLVHELRQRLGGKADIFFSRCEAFGKVTPYQAFLRPLRQALGLDGLGAERSPLEVADESLKAMGLGEHLSVFSSLLALKTDAPVRFPPYGGEQLRERILRALVDLFHALSRERPVVLLIEDWHWADEGSTTASHYLANSLAEHAILFIITHRPGESVSLPDLATIIDLAPLSPADSAQFAESLFASGALPAWLAHAVYEHTGGNAFFVEEVCQSLLNSRWTWKQTPGLGIERSGRLPIPDTIQAVLRARIDSLRASDAEILKFASVIGTEFSRWQLELLVNASADANLNWVECMSRLVRADLVYREENRGDDVYRFKHAITQEVAYEMLPRQRRRELHQRAAKAIERHHEESLDEHCEALAFHYGAAEEHELAAVYAEKAGDKAARTFSLEEARQHYRQAIACIDRLEPIDDRVRRRIAIGLKWAAACMFKPSQEQLDVLRISLDHARRIGDAKGGAYTQSWLGSIEYALGDQERAIAEFVECMGIARELADERLVAQLHLNLGQSHAAAAEYPKALEHLYEGLDRKAQVPSRRGGASSQSSSGVGRAYALGYLGLLHGDMGEFDRAFVYLEEALALVGAGRSRALEGSILTQMAMVQLWQGDWQACLSTSAMMQRTAERVHGPYILAMSKTVSGYANSMLVTGEEGISALTDAVAWLESTQIGLTMSWNRACLAEVLALSSHHQEGEAQATKALERLSAKDRLGEAAAHRALGIAAGARGAFTDAAPHFERSLVAAERKASRRDAAITRFRGAEVALRATAGASGSHRELAMKWLTSTISDFDAMNMPWYLAQARAALGED